MSFENLKIETTDGIAVVTVNRPDKLNALNDRTMEELDAAFTALAGDPETRGVILTGAGEKAFVAGADIGELSTQSPVQGKERSIRGQRILDRIENLGKPVIAAVNGFALAVAASWPWPATCGSHPRTRASARPRSSSGSCADTRGRSG